MIDAVLTISIVLIFICIGHIIKEPMTYGEVIIITFSIFILIETIRNKYKIK